MEDRRRARGFCEMTPLPLAIVGFGRLGRACAHAVLEEPRLTLRGVVRRPDSAPTLPAPFESVPAAGHLADLGNVRGVLLCVPPAMATSMARAVLQMRIPLVECAQMEDKSSAAHREAIHAAALQLRVPAVVGAGGDPGMLPLLSHAFDVLIPHGRTALHHRPGASLHHTEVARNIPGIRGALALEARDEAGRSTRYVYAELAPDTDADHVQRLLDADPLFAGERTLLFQVDSIQAMEDEGRGLLLERRGSGRFGAHHNLLLEARFDVSSFAARVMVAAACCLPALKRGAHRYSASLPGGGSAHLEDLAVACELPEWRP